MREDGDIGGARQISIDQQGKLHWSPRWRKGGPVHHRVEGFGLGCVLDRLRECSLWLQLPVVVQW